MLPITNRMLHMASGAQIPIPYTDEAHPIFSVSRRGMFELLLTELDATSVEMRYQCKVVSVTSSGEVTYTNHSGEQCKVQSLVVIGADGAYSKVRDEMRRFTRMDFEMKYIAHGYKEISLPAVVAADGTRVFPLHPSAFHLWARHGAFMFGLPNFDKSYTSPLIFPLKGPESVENVNSDDEIIEFFSTRFADIMPMISRDDLIHQFRSSPTSPLLIVRCGQYASDNGRVCIIGDAAHAALPFGCVGMNAAFEDALLLSHLIADNEDQNDLSKALCEFSRQRQP